MTMIYFAGPLLDWVFADPRTVIRGYDSAGNQLARVSVSTRVNTDYIDSVSVSGSTETVLRTHSYQCMTSNGATSSASYSQTFTRAAGSEEVPANALAPIDFAPRAIAARRDGWIFSASGPISFDFSTATGVPVRTLLDGAGNYGYVDFFRVYRANGDRVDFPQLHGAAIRDIALDSTECIIVCGQEASDRAVLRKYTKDGSLIWSKTCAEITSHYYFAYHCHIDSSDNIYVLMYQSPDPIADNVYLGLSGYSCLVKYNSSGAYQWAWMFNEPLRSVTTDSGGSVYIPGGWQFRYLPVEDADIDYNDFIYYDTVNQSRPLVAKLSPTDGAPTTYLAQDASVLSPGDRICVKYGGGYVHYNTSTAGLAADDTFFDYRKLSHSDLSVINQEWWDTGQSPFEVSAGGIAYFGDRRESDVNIFHLKSRSVDCARTWGDEVEGNPWAFLSATNTTGVNELDGSIRTDSAYFDVDYVTPYGAAAGPDYWSSSLDEPWFCLDIWVSESTKIPPMSIGVKFGRIETIGDTYVVVPGCRLPATLGFPVVRREYLGALRLPDVYRASIGVALWLSVSSFSIRRSVAGDYLSIVVPGATTDVINAVLALDGETITLWRGVRMAGNLEQLETMLSVPLSAIRYDRGSRSGSISLSGSIAVTPLVNRHRELSGIRYKAIIGGERRVRCAVDTYLAPGDIATIGTESMIVSTIIITVSPSDAIMEVSESP